MIKALAAPLLAIAILAGCAATGGSAYLGDIPDAKRAGIDTMPDLGDKELSLRPHEVLGKVEGVSCKRSYWGSSPRWDETIQLTKYEAMKKGANAIARLACSAPEGRSYTKLCFDAIRCTADAVRLEN